MTNTAHKLSTAATISLADTQQKLSDVGVNVWNVLTDEWFKGEMIPGSRRAPLSDIGALAKRSGLPKDAPIITYCAGPKCPASGKAAEELASLGYTNVRAFEGGLEEWKQAGLPIAVVSGGETKEKNASCSSC